MIYDFYCYHHEKTHLHHELRQLNLYSWKVDRENGDDDEYDDEMNDANDVNRYTKILKHLHLPGTKGHDNAFLISLMLRSK